MLICSLKLEKASCCVDLRHEFPLGSSFQSLMSPWELLDSNKRLPAIGEFMKKTIEQAYAKEGKACNVKYIDPSYMIR